MLWGKGEPVYVGKVVTFESHGIPRVGMVVNENLYAWCPGANNVTVLGDDGNLYGMPTCAGAFKVVALDGNLEVARAFYRAHLSQYPVWRARFAEQPNYAPF